MDRSASRNASGCSSGGACRHLLPSRSRPPVLGARRLGHGQRRRGSRGAPRSASWVRRSTRARRRRSPVGADCSMRRWHRGRHAGRPGAVEVVGGERLQRSPGCDDAGRRGRTRSGAIGAVGARGGSATKRAERRGERGRRIEHHHEAERVDEDELAAADRRARRQSSRDRAARVVADQYRRRRASGLDQRVKPGRGRCPRRPPRRRGRADRARSPGGRWPAGNHRGALARVSAGPCRSTIGGPSSMPSSTAVEIPARYDPSLGDGEPGEEAPPCVLAFRVGRSCGRR